MASPAPDEAESQQRDRRRAREVYKYFQPSNPALLAHGLQPSSEGGVPSFGGDGTDGAPSKASSPNITLTAYAQYIAIRLNAKRALISLIASDQLYDIAEATKTLNISNTDVYYEEGDKLWVGCQNVPKKDRLCAHVVDLPRPETGYAFFIVNDMSKDPRFNTLSFVEGAPFFRFYAGTPLVTDRGINIGSVFVLDDKPRNGLDDDEKEFLGTMASVCMSYLYTTREASLRRKGARLTQSVRHFGEGRVSFVLGSPLTMVGAKYGSAVTELFDAKQHTDIESNSDTLSFLAGSSKGSKDSFVSTSLPISRSSVYPSLTTAERHTLVAFMGDKGQQQRESLMQIARSDFEVRGWTMARAANLVREALDLDERGGVVFFDANQDFLRVFDAETESMETNSTSDEPEGVVDAHFQTSPDWGPPSGNDIREAFLGIEKKATGARPRKLASVLASSTASHPFALSNNINYDLPIHQFPAFLLQKVLKRNPAGKVWTFDAEDLITTEPESEINTPDLRPKSRGERMSRNTGTLQRIFPGARHLVFMPLWDAGRGQWSAGCFVWSTSATQLLDVDTDLLYIEALTRAVTTEISRLETIQADQQKSDFIGSISHELRSPLHGILASLEFLNDTSVDAFQRNLISTIETCGRTLLDTINHVLDYSKINSFGRDRRRENSRRADNIRRPSRSGSLPVEAPPLVSTYAETNVATILEEVIEGVKVGQQYKVSSIYDGEASSPSPNERYTKIKGKDVTEMKNASTEVDIDLDIAPGDWTFQTQPGALRRCFMNIFGNALKYTERGSINVSLRSRELVQQAKLRPGNGRLVIFQVSDTGRGISPQFLRSKIYTPFAQEDSLAPGTGLGLSLVRSIVAMLDGRIDIESRQGRGTTVTIVLPLMRRSEDENPIPKSTPNPLSTVELERSVRLDSAQLKVSVYSIQRDWRSNEPAIQPLYRVATYVSDWLHMQIIPWENGPLEANVCFVNDAGMAAIKEMVKTKVQGDHHVVYVCTNMSDEPADMAQLRALGFRVHRISKPCGPRKLGDILRLCVEESQISLPSPSTEAPLDLNAPSSDAAEAEVSAIVEKLRVLLLHSPELATRSTALKGLVRSVVTAEESQEPATSETEQTPKRDTFFGDAPLSPVSGRLAAPQMPKRRSLAEQTAAPSTPSKVLTEDVVSDREPRVLLVEDNKINLRLLQTFMNKRNLKHVDSAENGKLAFDAVQAANQPYDIIFMDITMPVMNGFEATSAIRKYEEEQQKINKRYGSATIVALTGLASAEDQERAQDVGMDLFLIKPVSFKEVAKLLDNWAPDSK